MKLSVIADQQIVEKRSHTVPTANARVKFVIIASDSTGEVVPKEIDLAQLARMHQVQLLEALFRRPSLSTTTYLRCSHRPQDLQCVHHIHGRTRMPLLQDPTTSWSILSCCNQISRGHPLRQAGPKVLTTKKLRVHCLHRFHIYSLDSRTI